VPWTSGTLTLQTERRRASDRSWPIPASRSSGTLHRGSRQLCATSRLSPSSAPVWRFRRDRENRVGRQVRRKFRRYPVQPEPEHRGFVRQANQLVADVAARNIFWHPNTHPTEDITLPVGTHQATVNRVPLEPGETYYDVIQRELQREREGSDSVLVVDLGVRTMRS
jgi:hypothetical protein